MQHKVLSFKDLTYKFGSWSNAQLVYCWALIYSIKTCNHLKQIVKNSYVQPKWLIEPTMMSQL